MKRFFMKKFIYSIMFFITASTAQYSFASAITHDDLRSIVIQLNNTCGDNWCDGEDYGYEFKKAEFDSRSRRLTLSVKFTPSVPEVKPLKKSLQKCVMYNFASYEELFDEERRAISEALYTEVSNCLHTIGANL